MTNILLSLGARVDARDAHGLPPLFFAIWTAGTDDAVARTLIHWGAETFATAPGLENFLVETAERLGKKELAQMLRGGSSCGKHVICTSPPLVNRRGMITRYDVTTQRHALCLEDTHETVMVSDNDIRTGHPPLFDFKDRSHILQGIQADNHGNMNTVQQTHFLDKKHRESMVAFLVISSSVARWALRTTIYLQACHGGVLAKIVGAPSDKEALKTAGCFLGGWYIFLSSLIFWLCGMDTFEHFLTNIVGMLPPYKRSSPYHVEIKVLVVLVWTLFTAWVTGVFTFSAISILEKVEGFVDA
mmetsp:Transcript_32213/g.78286  ORF Transcript_32213/g.78286 Transcript_32213/m.78286 type:complete len:301 (+) Transcript_32213:2244-3146(+)